MKTKVAIDKQQLCIFHLWENTLNVIYRQVTNGKIEISIPGIFQKKTGMTTLITDRIDLRKEVF